MNVSSKPINVSRPTIQFHPLLKPRSIHKKFEGLNIFKYIYKYFLSKDGRYNLIKIIT